MDDDEVEVVEGEDDKDAADTWSAELTEEEVTVGGVESRVEAA